MTHSFHRFFSTTVHNLERRTALSKANQPWRPSFTTHLPAGYTYYRLHNDIPMTAPPPHAKIYESAVEPPHLPRTGVFHYLFPPDVKGVPPRYYPAPDPQTVAFIDGLTGRTLFRSDLPIQAKWLHSGLTALGVRRKETACLFGENSLEWVSACYGAQAAGMIVSPANYG